MTFNWKIPRILIVSFILTTLVIYSASTNYVCVDPQFCVREKLASMNNVFLIKDMVKNYITTNKLGATKMPFTEQIENIMKDLTIYKWEKAEMQCLSKLLSILKGVQNQTLWATWVWDANQAPVGVLLGSTLQFGSYDACLNPPWLNTHTDLKTKYCLADVSLKDQRTKKIYNDPYTPMEEYMKGLRALRALKGITRLGGRESSRAKTPFLNDNKLRKESETEYKIKFNAFTWGMCVPLVCEPKSIRKFAETILNHNHYGFLTSLADITIPSCEGPESETDSTGFYLSILIMLFSVIAVCASSIYLKIRDHNHPDTLGAQIVKSFSLTHNNVLLFGKACKNEIHVLHGIRFLSIIVELFYHVWVLSDWIGYRDALHYEKQIENKSVLYHLDIVVDTFFVIAGLLFMRNLLSNCNINIVTTIVKRYLRCNYLLGLIIISSPYLGKYLLYGPVFLKYGKLELDLCQTYWWTNMLTIQNYMESKYICYGNSWSLAADFHMTLIGSILFLLYRDNKGVGVIAFLVLSAVSIILPAVYIYKRDLLGVPKFDMTVHKRFKEELFTEIYMQTHLRMGPHLVGFAFGYLFAMYKPASNRNVISKKFSIIGFLLSMSICGSVLTQGAAHYDVRHSAFDSAVFGALNRSKWALGVGLFISIAEYGHIPYINDFLGSSFFVPLSKLTYGIFLNNVSIYAFKIYNTKTPIAMNWSLWIMDTAGLTVLSCIVSYITWVIFEAPMNNLVVLFLKIK